MLFFLLVAFSVTDSLPAEKSSKRPIIRSQKIGVDIDAAAQVSIIRTQKIGVDIDAAAQVTQQATSDEVPEDDAESAVLLAEEDSAQLAEEDKEAEEERVEEEEENERQTATDKHNARRACPLTPNEPGEPIKANTLLGNTVDVPNGRGWSFAYLDVPAACADCSCPILVVFNSGLKGLRWQEAAHDVGFLLVSTPCISSTTCPLVNKPEFLKNFFQKVSPLGNGEIFAGGCSKGGAAAQNIIAKNVWPIKGVIAQAAPLRKHEHIQTTAPKVCYIEFHSTDDPFVPYDGTRGRAGQFMPVMESMQLWTDHNGCKKVPKESETSTGMKYPSPFPFKTFKTTHYVWDCPSGQHVEHYKVNDEKSHQVPFSVGGEGFGQVAFKFLLACRAATSTSPTPIPASTSAPAPNPIPTPASSSCGKWCARQTNPNKCRWDPCSGCAECTSGPSSCKTWCAKTKDRRKCTWATCSGCADC